MGFDDGVMEDFKAENGQMAFLYGSTEKTAARRVVLLGLGEGRKLDDYRERGPCLQQKPSK